jgi:hypothetical protein
LQHKLGITDSEQNITDQHTAYHSYLELNQWRLHIWPSTNLDWTCRGYTEDHPHQMSIHHSAIETITAIKAKQLKLKVEHPAILPFASKS